jgi:hypothetical protein
MGFGMLACLLASLPIVPAAEPALTAEPAPSEPKAPPAAARTPAAAQIDLSFVPASATVALVMHPQPVLAGPNAVWVPVEVMTAAGIQEYGIDPVTVQAVIVCFVPPTATDAKTGVTMGLVARFNKPYSKAALLSKFVQSKQVEVGGKTLYRVNARDDDCLYFPDAKTIVFAPQALLIEMLAAKDVNSPLTKLLYTADCSATYTVLASFDAMRDLLTDMVVKLPRLPPQLDRFRKAPLLISSARLTLDCANGGDFNLTLHAVDDGAADELLELTRNGVALLHQILLGQLQQGMGIRRTSNDPLQQAASKYLARIFDHLFESVKPVRSGRDIRLALHTDAGPTALGGAAALLLPAIQAQRAEAERNFAQFMIKQIGLALLNEENAFGKFPQRAICDDKGKPLLSWRVKILPYLEEAELYRQFHLDEPWNSPNNKPLIAKIPHAYCNPSRPVDGKTNFLAVVGPGLAFESKITAGAGRRISEISDGTSKTIAVVEADEDRAVIWTKPDDLEVNLDKPLAGLGHFRPDGTFNAVFFDDHVRAIPNTIDPKILRALFTIAGREPIPPF